MAKFRITLSAFFAVATRTGVISAAVRSGLCLSHIRLKRAISPSMHAAAKSSGIEKGTDTLWYKLTYITNGTVCSSLYNSVTQSTPSTFTDPSILRIKRHKTRYHVIAFTKIGALAARKMLVPCSDARLVFGDS